VLLFARVTASQRTASIYMLKTYTTSNCAFDNASTKIHANLVFPEKSNEGRS